MKKDPNANDHAWAPDASMFDPNRFNMFNDAATPDATPEGA